MILCLISELLLTLLETHSLVTEENIDHVLIWRRKAVEKGARGGEVVLQDNTGYQCETSNKGNQTQRS